MNKYEECEPHGKLWCQKCEWASRKETTRTNDVVDGLNQSDAQVQALVSLACQVTGANVTDVINPKHKFHSASLTRQIVSYIMRVHWQAYYHQVSEVLGCTTTNVQKILKTLKLRMINDRELRAVIEYVYAELGNNKARSPFIIYLDDLIDIILDAYWLPKDQPFQNNNGGHLDARNTKARQVACYIMYFKHDIHPQLIAHKVGLTYRRIYANAKEVRDKLEKKTPDCLELKDEVKAIEEHLGYVMHNFKHPEKLRFAAYDPALDFNRPQGTPREFTGVKPKGKWFHSPLSRDEHKRIMNEPGPVPELNRQGASNYRNRLDKKGRQKFTSGDQPPTPWRNDKPPADESLWVVRGRAGCGHHWKVDAPNGPTSLGHCTKCTAQKYHRNSPRRIGTSGTGATKTERTVGA